MTEKESTANDVLKRGESRAKQQTFITESELSISIQIKIASQGGKPMTGNVMKALLTLMMSERLGGDAGAISTPRNASAEAIRKRIEGNMKSA